MNGDSVLSLCLLAQSVNLELNPMYHNCNKSKLLSPLSLRMVENQGNTRVPNELVDLLHRLSLSVNSFTSRKLNMLIRNWKHINSELRKFKDMSELQKCNSLKPIKSSKQVPRSSDVFSRRVNLDEFKESKLLPFQFEKENIMDQMYKNYISTQSKDAKPPPGFLLKEQQDLYKHS